VTTNKHMREQLGELTEDEVRQIIEQLDFCDRLARQVNPHYDNSLTPLIERLEFLLGRARRRQALDDLEAGQCDGTVGACRCELTMGHEGDHELDGVQDEP